MSAGPDGGYDEDWYRSLQPGAAAAARTFAERLWRVHQPRRVVDVGCGHGDWLAAFDALGSTRLVGFDGPWNSQEGMASPRIAFHPVELDRPGWIEDHRERFDLAISLETAEHLTPARSEPFVRAMCALADVVLFGAGFLHQPGVGHSNLKRHSEWAALFAAQGYHVYDYFRPVVAGASDIPYWYQQNTFLYVRQGHPLEESLRTEGFVPVANLAFLDLVHPQLLGLYVDWFRQARGDEGYPSLGLALALRQFLKHALPSGVTSRLRKSPGATTSDPAGR